MDEDGYRLWLRYDKVSSPALLAQYRAAFGALVLDASAPSPTLLAAQRELLLGLEGLLASAIRTSSSPGTQEFLVIGTPRSSRIVAALQLSARPTPLGREGFVIERGTVAGVRCTVIAGHEDAAVLYGVFHFLRLLQTQRELGAFAVQSAPKLTLRMLDHWDNLDRTIERGYAGFSLWDWHKLPDYLDPRYLDYARANASLGINAVVLNNVNASSLVLTAPYLEKVAALAAVFRPFGIRVYLSARFSAPIEIGGLSTADPLEPVVVAFWSDKVAEIYDHVPDFGGFLVKANSEGQPGPQDYGRSHAEGANLLADALLPHRGVVIWRAFVYRAEAGSDRAKQAYEDLAPLDGRFRNNALVQVKNGPIDFQPREPFHPLFGALRSTGLIAEFQITQEYLGCATHLVYLGPLFQEVLQADTHAQGPGSTVARVLEGAGSERAPSGMAGVANIGSDRNWCGHPFAQANWFAFGRLCWDPELSSEAIADEWIRMTFNNEPHFVAQVRKMMLGSREAAVNYMTPLGLHHLMAWDHHYGPGPWIDQGRPDWTSVYFHRADSQGLGFDRSTTGSNALSQYAPAASAPWAEREACPESLLLWFHRVPWDAPLGSGKTLWQTLCEKYYAGVAYVAEMRLAWAALARYVDVARHEHVSALLKVQEQEAKWWRDACLLYFQTFSKQPIPPSYEPPSGTLEGYIRMRHRFVPGIRDSG